MPSYEVPQIDWSPGPSTRCCRYFRAATRILWAACQISRKIFARAMRAHCATIMLDTSYNETSINGINILRTQRAIETDPGDDSPPRASSKLGKRRPVDGCATYYNCNRLVRIKQAGQAAGGAGGAGGGRAAHVNVQEYLQSHAGSTVNCVGSSLSFSEVDCILGQKWSALGSGVECTEHHRGSMRFQYSHIL